MARIPTPRKPGRFRRLKNRIERHRRRAECRRIEAEANEFTRQHRPAHVTIDGPYLTEAELDLILEEVS